MLELKGNTLYCNGESIGYLSGDKKFDPHTGLPVLSIDLRLDSDFEFHAKMNNLFKFRRK